MRFGGATADANVDGVKASIIGNATATPAARKKLRRLVDGPNEFFMCLSAKFEKVFFGSLF
jgi:hypothetical protein